jgi:hypothetical protein
VSLWKTWNDVWDKMVVEEELTRTYPWWSMHQRIASGSLGVEVPDVMEKGKWMFNQRNQASHEESHISKCQSLLHQDIKWHGYQKWKLIFHVKYSKSQAPRVKMTKQDQVWQSSWSQKEMKWQQSILCKLKLKNCILYLILSIGCRYIKRNTTWVANKVSILKIA